MIPAYCQQWRNGFDDAVKTYQRSIYDIALNECGERRGVAVDAGAHVGIFTRRMEEDFRNVYSFEPVPENFQCLANNCKKATIFNCGLGMFGRKAIMHNPSPNNSGAWEEAKEGIETRLIALDSLGLTELDLFKMDVQGAEPAALRGAVETIRGCRPVILTEVMAATKTEIRDILVRWNYRLKREEGDDQVWVPND